MNKSLCIGFAAAISRRIITRGENITVRVTLKGNQQPCGQLSLVFRHGRYHVNFLHYWRYFARASSFSSYNIQAVNECSFSNFQLIPSRS